MKNPLSLCAWICLTALLMNLTAPVTAETRPAQYEVTFKGAVVATQDVSIVGSPEWITVTSTFKAELPVFVATHRYSETLSASFRPDGSVVRLKTLRADGAEITDIAGNVTSNGMLKVVRRTRQGTSTNFIAREEYDFNSLVFYGTAPDAFLPTHRPVRVLQIDTGRVEPVDLRTISESDTFERQHLVSQHLIWKTPPFTSHTWHPERFSNLPRRYIRQTENGEFTFTLLR